MASSTPEARLGLVLSLSPLRSTHIIFNIPPSEKKMCQLQAKIGSFFYDDRVALFALSFLK